MHSLQTAGRQSSTAAPAGICRAQLPKVRAGGPVALSTRRPDQRNIAQSLGDHSKSNDGDPGLASAAAARRGVADGLAGGQTGDASRTGLHCSPQLEPNVESTGPPPKPRVGVRAAQRMKIAHEAVLAIGKMTPTPGLILSVALIRSDAWAPGTVTLRSSQ